MCFDYDFDWYAEVNETEFLPKGKQRKCDECGVEMAENEPRTRIKQQEHEQCQLCEDEFSDYYIEPEERDAGFKCDHDYGETFEIEFCENCRKIIEAIVEYEKREGCPVGSRQPAHGALWDEMSQHEQASDYLQFAAEMFPEVQESILYKTFGPK